MQEAEARRRCGEDALHYVNFVHQCLVPGPPLTMPVRLLVCQPP